jgi:hypothetical protein
MALLLQRIGVLAASVQGWVFLIGSVLPMVWVFVSGILEVLLTSFIALTAWTLAEYPRK